LNQTYFIGRLCRRGWLWVIISLVAGVCRLQAQLPETVYLSGSRIDSLHVHKLFVTVDNLSFFKNNEWASNMAPGYTLPGFWIQPKAVYYPAKNIKLEGGVHSLWFWGTNQYPSYAYSQLPYWNKGQKQATHILPYFRAQIAFSRQVQLVFGNIYGGANHRLIEPLYHPELNLTADPETGLQLLYDLPWLQLDTWVNWTKFIYRSDTHQESFVYGLSSRLRGNRPEARLHVSFPVQVLAQHQGGQIDATDLPVQTVLNAAVGAALDWNLRRGALERISLEWALAGSYQHAGQTWPLKRGHGSFTSLTATWTAFSVKSAYWECDRFISLFGNPLYGAPSLAVQDAYFEHPKMIVLGAAYTRTFAPGMALGIDFDLYYRLDSYLNDPASGVSPVDAKANYSFGIYFRVNPSFLLVKTRKQL
jgi:hypothetical protein